MRNSHSDRIIELETELANDRSRIALLESLLKTSQEDLAIMREWYAQQLASINAKIPNPTDWHSYLPKNGDVTAVKLTRENLGRIAKRISDAGVSVQVYQSCIETPAGSFMVDEWLLEDWDYAKGRPVYRLASVNERDWFDLR